MTAGRWVMNVASVAARATGDKGTGGKGQADAQGQRAHARMVPVAEGKEDAAGGNEAPGTVTSSIHIVMALKDFLSSFSAQVTIVLSCIQARQYYQQGHIDLAYVSAGIIAFFGLWSVCILGLVSLSAQSTCVGTRKAPKPYDTDTGTTSGGVPYDRMNGLDLVIPTSPYFARLNPPAAALTILLQGPIVVLSWETLRDALNEAAKFRVAHGADPAKERGCTGSRLTEFEAELVRNPVEVEELDTLCSGGKAALPFTEFVCAGQPAKATFHCVLFVQLFTATFLTFPQLILQAYVMFARGGFDALSIFSLGNMVFGYAMATTSALQKRVDVGGKFAMWFGGMLVSAGQIINRAFSMCFLCIAFGGWGALYVLMWMISDTFCCVALNVYKETKWDPLTYGLFDFTVAPGGIVMLGWRASIEKVLNFKQIWIILVRLAFGWGAFLIALYKAKRTCQDGEDFTCLGCCNRPLVPAEVLSIAGGCTASVGYGLVVMAIASALLPATASSNDSGGNKVHPVDA